jgi:hypothetical protein
MSSDNAPEQPNEPPPDAQESPLENPPDISWVKFDTGLRAHIPDTEERQHGR